MTSRTQNDWDLHFMERAHLISKMSKDPSTKVGAVIVDSNKYSVADGYNGFPKGIEDDGRLDNRAVKYDIIIHGEMNAILTAGRQGKPVIGCTLYTWPLPPCIRCATAIVQSGIKRVVSFYPEGEQAQRWLESCQQAQDILEEGGVEVVWYANEIK